MSCGAPEQGGALTGLAAQGVNVAKETVIQGSVVRDGTPVPGAFVRLLDGSGEFTAEVVTSPQGEFRFFAAPGSWTLRALAPGAKGEQVVQAAQGEVQDVRLAVSS